MKLGKNTAAYGAAIASAAGATGISKALQIIHDVENPKKYVQVKSGASNGAKDYDFFGTDNDGPV